MGIDADSVTCPEVLMWLSAIVYSINCRVGSVLLVHEGRFRLFETPCLSLGSLDDACLEHKT